MNIGNEKTTSFDEWYSLYEPLENVLNDPPVKNPWTLMETNEVKFIVQGVHTTSETCGYYTTKRYPLDNEVVQVPLYNEHQIYEKFQPMEKATLMFFLYYFDHNSMTFEQVLLDLENAVDWTNTSIVPIGNYKPYSPNYLASEMRRMYEILIKSQP